MCVAVLCPAAVVSCLYASCTSINSPAQQHHQQQQTTNSAVYGDGYHQQQQQELTLLCTVIFQSWHRPCHSSCHAPLMEQHIAKRSEHWLLDEALQTSLPAGTGVYFIILIEYTLSCLLDKPTGVKKHLHKYCKKKKKRAGLDWTAAFVGGRACVCVHTG